MPEAVTAYKCKHCGTKFVRLTKYAVQQHEKWCYSLPQNQAICWDGCIHYTRGLKDDEGNYFPHYCSEHDTEMESMKMKVRRDSSNLPCSRSPLMPTECKDFDAGHPEHYDTAEYTEMIEKMLKDFEEA